jgi:hypothetical protein
VRGSQEFQKLLVNMAGDGPASRQGSHPLAWPLWGLGIRDGTDRSSLLPPRPSSRWQLPSGHPTQRPALLADAAEERERLGLAIPFFLSALALNRFLDFFDRFKRVMPAVSVAGGIFLVFVGALLLTNYFTLLSAYALRLTPQWLWQRL